MPRKVGFSVAAVSSEDELHAAEELNSHGPTVQGWWSARFCGFPQEVVLQLEGRVHVCKIQILSHQFIIASQIEILVGDVDEGQAVNHRNAKYKRLGYVSLSDNEKTNLTARELKSVHVNVIGSFLKFVVPKNHINRQNLFNQVGIVAINVIGDDLVEGGGPPMTGSEPISALDDLTFDMYQDPEVGQIIRKLDVRKVEAVKEEKFESAKRLKVAIAELLKIGEKLGKYEVEKRQAIEAEDYDTARRKKAQMEEFRLRCYERLRVHELMGGKEFITRDPPKHQNGYAPRHDYELSDSSSSEGFEGVLANHLPNIPQPKPAKNAQGTPMTTYAAYEERALPTFRAGSDPFDDEDTFAGGNRMDPRRNKTKKRSNLTEQDKRQMILPVEVFGSLTVEHAYSKIFSQREESLRDVKRQVEDFEVLHSHVAPVRFLRAATMLVQKALKDIVLSVFIESLDVLKTLLCHFPKQRKIPKSEIANVVEKTLPEIHIKLGDKAARQRSAAHRYIMEMVDFPEVRALQTVPAHFCQPLAGNVQPRLAHGQVQLVEQLVAKLGVEKDSGLSVSTVMAFAVPALQHPSGSVREAAERIIINLYKMKGREVRRYLPAEEERTRRNTLHRHLYEELDRIEAEERRSSVVSNLSSHGDGSRTSEISSPDLVEKLEKLCIFCGERNDSFTSSGLDLHYWKSCPMLTRCANCEQVVEISGLTEHVLTECSSKDQYAKCNRCQATLKKSEYTAHVKLKACKATTSVKTANRCPLCHRNVAPGDDGWKRHLMGIDSCEKNPRRKRGNAASLRFDRYVNVVGSNNQ